MPGLTNIVLLVERRIHQRGRDVGDIEEEVHFVVLQTVILTRARSGIDRHGQHLVKAGFDARPSGGAYCLPASWESGAPKLIAHRNTKTEIKGLRIH
jgi:hypothetical protein